MVHKNNKLKEWLELQGELGKEWLELQGKLGKKWLEQIEKEAAGTKRGKSSARLIRKVLLFVVYCEMKSGLDYESSFAWSIVNQMLPMTSHGKQFIENCEGGIRWDQLFYVVLGKILDRAQAHDVKPKRIAS
jgi:hypothetical protein